MTWSAGRAKEDDLCSCALDGAELSRLGRVRARQKGYCSNRAAGKAPTARAGAGAGQEYGIGRTVEMLSRKKPARLRHSPEV